ncbi:MAG TPA: hypothetical protein VKS60_00205 [Stellaceae bacterium]|nr:hypothetical protein [Stellaceae bacterium]
MTWTVDNSGTQTASVGTEQTLDNPTTNGTYVLRVNVSNLANGETVELRVYDKLNSNTVQCWKAAISGPVINGIVQSPPLAADAGCKATLKQLNGTGRSFDWSLLRI